MTKSAARPGKKPAPVTVSKSRPDAEETLKIVLDCLDEMKAEDTVTIDLRGKSSLADYMIVTTGRANRHVGAIAENVVKDLGEVGMKGLHVEGLPNCDWVLIDTGDIIVHVFRPEVRSVLQPREDVGAGAVGDEGELSQARERSRFRVRRRPCASL